MIRVAIVGVGNCASALVQGVEYYRQDNGVGIMHEMIGPYHASDLEFVAAFDVDVRKVGVPLNEAIFLPPNNTVRFAAGLPDDSPIVQRGPVLDGIGRYVEPVVSPSDSAVVNIAAVLRESRAQVLVNYLPVGSEAATYHYMRAALEARVAVVNCIPVFIAKHLEWQAEFRRAGVPIIGDDVKSQVGATIVHRVLTRLFERRGVRIDHTYQLNVGGNTDFLNMLERGRLVSKKISKTQAVTSQIIEQKALPEQDVHIGPSDYVPWLEDRKMAFIRLEGTGFGGQPINIELKLDVWDSPNSAGVVIDAIRYAKLGLDRKLKGPLIAPSAFLMKSPPTQMTDDEAWEDLEEFRLFAEHPVD